MGEMKMKGPEDPCFMEDNNQVVGPIKTATATNNNLLTVPKQVRRREKEVKTMPVSDIPQKNAVVVRDAFKEFKSKKGPNVVLENYNMTVKEGTIYGLLGSSGCGKTTILSCCVGVQALDSGHILINGAEPGTRESGVPGKAVGYMPQETALYEEFSIQEVLQYYGRVYGMTSKMVSENINTLIAFLALPDPHRRIASLSGGQQRRVSIAVALIHNPKLLILDEPTVGVDPLLRQSIWDHLVKLVSTGKTTVIITTHYIEEARQTHTIGLMRGGRLLTEDSPERLMKKHKAKLLEEIVLKLCLRDNNDEDDDDEEESTWDITSIRSSIHSVARSLSQQWRRMTLTEIPRNSVISGIGISISAGKEKDGDNDGPFNNNLAKTFGKNDIASDSEGVVGLSYSSITNGEGRGREDDRGYLSDCSESNISSSTFSNLRRKSTDSEKSIIDELSVLERDMIDIFNRIYAMSRKNITILLRNFLMLLFMILVPSSQIIIICMAIGQDPKGLHFGLVNNDLPNPNNLTECEVPRGCIAYDNFTGSVSCLFIDYLKAHGILDVRHYETEEAASKAVVDAADWGYMVFPENYTLYMKERAIFGVHAETEVIYGGRIKFRLDQSNLQIYRENAKLFYKTFREFTKNLSEECGLDAVQTDLPLYFDDPIYGNESITYTDFLAPSVLLAILFFFPMCGSSVAYISEKRAGNLARILVAGAKTWEVMLAYLVVHLVVLAFQIGLSFIIMVSFFNIQIVGHVFWAIALALLVGLSGMAAGFVLATFCNEEIEAVLLALGAFLPNFLLSGMVWPFQGMPVYLQYVSYILPCTLACEAMRSIVSRGVDITHPVVWAGYVSTFAWILIYWSITIIIQRISSKK